MFTVIVIDHPYSRYHHHKEKTAKVKLRTPIIAGKVITTTLTMVNAREDGNGGDFKG